MNSLLSSLPCLWLTPVWALPIRLCPPPPEAGGSGLKGVGSSGTCLLGPYPCSTQLFLPLLHVLSAYPTSPTSHCSLWEGRLSFYR